MNPTNNSTPDNQPPVPSAEPLPSPALTPMDFGPASPVVEPTVVAPSTAPPAPIDPLHPAVIQAAAEATAAAVTPPAAGVVVSSDPTYPPQAGMPAAPLPPPASGGRKRSMKTLLIAAAAVVVIGLGSAVTYAAVIVPNKPANVLKSALENSVQQTQVSFTGSVQGGPATGSGTAYKATFIGAEDTKAKATDLQLNLTISGVTFPVEARLVNQNLYVKLGDTSTLTSLLTSVDPSLGSLGSSLSSLSGKWVEFDSTLLSEANASCTLNTNWTLTKADVQLLEQQYGKNPFVTIVSTSTDTINGKKVQKMQLNINDNALNSYAKNLKGLSLLKALNTCSKGSATTAENAVSINDGDTTPLTVWVDKSSNEIVQVASQSTAADAKKDNVKASGVVTFSYGKVTIVAPTGAEPAINVLNSLQTEMNADGINPSALLDSSIAGSGPTSDGFASTSGASNAADATRQSDIQSLQVQMEAYFAENGNYPSLTDVNSSAWRAQNMPDLDPNALKDPSGSSSTLTASPTAKAYAYSVTTDSGGSCEGDDTTCTKYTLTATLSAGGTYTKTNLD